VDEEVEQTRSVQEEVNDEKDKTDTARDPAHYRQVNLY
jgi:hypothetical protein